MTMEVALAMNGRRFTFAASDRDIVAVRQSLREMGTMIRQTHCPELGWLGDMRSGWPEAPQEVLGLKDRAEQAEAGGLPTVRIIEAKLAPEQISRAEKLLERVRRFPRHQAIIVVGWACKFHMGKVAKHRQVRCSRRHAWNILNGACEVLAREGVGRV